MKKILSLALVLCLLLCSCGTSTTPTEKEQTVKQSTTTTSNETSVDPTQTEVTPPTEKDQEEKVIVYLLEKSSLYDSGHTQYFYDENYNIDKCKVYTIENELVYTSYFENKDRNGMPQNYRSTWGESDSETWTLSWFEDGKLKEEQYVPGFSGSRYEYNYAGNLSEIRQYYDEELEFITRFSYDGDILTGISCSYGGGGALYKGIVEDGRIIEKICYDTDGSWSYSEHYKYDENGNLVKKILEYDGESIPSTAYTYRTVEVDVDRAHYLMEQQKYLISVH